MCKVNPAREAGTETKTLEATKRRLKEQIEGEACMIAVRGAVAILVSAVVVLAGAFALDEGRSKRVVGFSVKRYQWRRPRDPGSTRPSQIGPHTSGRCLWRYSRRRIRSTTKAANLSS
jgi:hypothetical protein